MITSSRMFKTVATVICTFILTASSFANSWWAKPYQGTRRDIVTLIITGNVDIPRILADVIQFNTKQPYVLLPAKHQTKLFFCAARGRESLELREADLTRFINFLNPEQIIVLGTPSFIGEKFAHAIPKTQTVIYFYNSDWAKVARSISVFLNKPNIYHDFVRLQAQYTAGKLYKPTPARKVEATVIEKDTQVFFEPSATGGATPAAPATVEETTAADTPAADTPATEPNVKMPEKAPVLIEAK